MPTSLTPRMEITEMHRFKSFHSRNLKSYVDVKANEFVEFFRECFLFPAA
jgi:hypothetical protein